MCGLQCWLMGCFIWACSLGLSQMAVAQAFDQDYAAWKAQQQAQDHRLSQQSTAQQPPAKAAHTVQASTTEVTAITSAVTNPKSADPIAVLQVHINTDSVQQLQQLKGIGAKKAQAIIDYRQQHGPFQRIEDLKKVKGIGEQTFEKNRVQLSL